MYPKQYKATCSASQYPIFKRQAACFINMLIFIYELNMWNHESCKKRKAERNESVCFYKVLFDCRKAAKVILFSGILICHPISRFELLRALPAYQLITVFTQSVLIFQIFFFRICAFHSLLYT